MSWKVIWRGQKFTFKKPEVIPTESKRSRTRQRMGQSLQPDTNLDKDVI